jgi:hypothetical protein
MVIMSLVDVVHSNHRHLSRRLPTPADWHDAARPVNALQELHLSIHLNTTSLSALLAALTLATWFACTSQLMALSED